jgi:adenine-specific DNA-methyltransferase
MKYMGSKRWMLRNGLGDLLTSESKRCTRFVDLFAGSGTVAAFVASSQKVSCHAYDLQSFSAVLSRTILARSGPLDADRIWAAWHARAKQSITRALAAKPQLFGLFKKAYVEECRNWCGARKSAPITAAYGGHYFSPEQALWIDALRATLPKNKHQSQAGLAALIQAASQCAASPGHTAQPFQPTRSAKRFIEEAWNKNIPEKTKGALVNICQQYALLPGEASVRDANKAAKGLSEGDLVFIDPPYSGVHYSRFYHVLETIARGSCSTVSGNGRYPAQEERPISRYSISTQACEALDDLLKTISERGATAILTFPAHRCSNGLSGDFVRTTATKYFRVREKVVESKFSTLGGTDRVSKNGNNRSARQHAKELILFLKPRCP